MRICKTRNNTLNFRARNPEIRKLDDISRKIRLRFPVISTSRLASLDSVKHFPGLYNRQAQKLDEIRFSYKRVPNLKNFFDRLLKLMKKYKVANCGELSLATLIGLKLNGYENCFRAALYACETETKNTHGIKPEIIVKNIHDIDHEVVIILSKPLNADDYEKVYHIMNQKDIIVDPLIGKADYCSNLKEEYAKSNLFYVGLENGEKLVYELDTEEASDLTKDILRKLKKYYIENTTIIKKLLNYLKNLF